ncbi:hypothetical protein LshimejAT787_0102670 [Lyophyllum shimeji]|uniref:Uncharacterized protein n=1 Tax=Lyophyllum shimeji TaxID=47721 RepID=A0A9P3UHQ8_LYOSH|nr:hypothetical protein LshimejAT787_0102670 [Lyophyllum shimeji]
MSTPWSSDHSALRTDRTPERADFSAAAALATTSSRTFAVASADVPQDLVLLAGGDETLQARTAKNSGLSNTMSRCQHTVSVIGRAKVRQACPYYVQDVVQHEVEVGQIQGPGLPPIELLGGQEVLEVLVVRVDFDLVPAPSRKCATPRSAG